MTRTINLASHSQLLTSVNGPSTDRDLLNPPPTIFLIESIYTLSFWAWWIDNLQVEEWQFTKEMPF